MISEKKAKSLTMAAVMMAALSVPAIAIAGPKFEELERAVAADVKDADAINAALLKALGTDRAAVRALQTECFGSANARLISGVLGGATQACIRDHADAMARARAHAAEDRKAIEASLATCTAGSGDCVKARDAAAASAAAAVAERDALRARLASGGDLYGDSDVRPIAKAQAYANAHCAPGSQPRWINDSTFVCTDPVFRVVRGECALDVSGGEMTCESSVEPPKGREGVVPFRAPPPLPEPKGTCDGAGGKLLCYVLPVTAAVIGGLLIADAASEDFNLVSVRR